MTGFDYLVIGIMLISVLLGFLRGVVREVLSLLSWVAAFWVAKTFVLDMMPMLADVIPAYPLRMFASFLLLFVVTLLAAKLLTLSISSLLRGLRLGGVDRFFGGLFGLARGVFLVALIVMLAGLTALPRETYWREAALSRPFETLVIFVKPWLPNEIAKRIKF